MPKQAVQPGNQLCDYEDGKLRIKKIRVARMTDELVLIESDEVDAGDRVVTSPIAAVEDGMDLRVQVNE